MQRANEVILRLPIGDLVGHKVLLQNLSWTPNQDPSEQIPPDRARFDANPLPPRSNVTVFTFLGVPYAEPPTGERRFKVENVLVSKSGHETSN